MTTKSTSIPPGLRPGLLTGVTDSDKVPGLGALRVAHKAATERAVKLVQGLEAVRDDPTRTGAQRVEAQAALLEKHAAGIRKTLEVARNEAVRAMAGEADAINRGLRQGLDLGERKEIRSVLRELPPGERRAAVMAALEAGDRLTVSAVLTAPSALTTGLGEGDLGMIRQKAVQRFFPEQHENMAALDTALDRFSQALDAVDPWADRLRPAGAKQVAERAAKAKAAAAAAMAG